MHGRPDQFGVGDVWHRRVREHDHHFRYSISYCLLDVDRIDQRLSRSRLWSRKPWAPVRYRRSDYMLPQDQSLGTVVRDRVEQHLGRRPAGQIRLLTQLRQWGLCFNPVSFYFCYARPNVMDCIVAEIHNTPWGERHAYVLDASGPNHDQQAMEFTFKKAFHVSPFLPMDMQYHWRIGLADDKVRIHMLVTEQGAESLKTGLQLELKQLDTRAMNRLPFQFPLQAAKVVGGIYWQAFRLWHKRTQFFPHPGRGSSS